MSEPSKSPVDSSGSIGPYSLGPLVRTIGTTNWYAAVVEATATAVRIARAPISTSETWPGIAWEADIRARLRHPGVPPHRDRFEHEGEEYLVLDDPAGVSLWDAWDDPAVGTLERYGWLLRLAELIRAVHRAGAVLDGLRPSQVRITALGEVVLAASVSLLPVPLPAQPRIEPSLVGAPELHRGGPVDARADLYHFGSVLYALELGRELAELDFAGPGVPHEVLAREPDIHPFLGLLLARTFVAERAARFPSEDATDDLSGFGELVRTLGQAQRLLAGARCVVAAWTSTGMVRANNEDAIAVVRSTELYDAALDEAVAILLADGMGGSAAGEVASRLTIQNLRRALMQIPPFAGVGDEPGLPQPPVDYESIVRSLAAALRDANRAVYLAARNSEHRGMGCTAEAVYVDGRHVVIGHVGDSRVYRLHRGELTQLTRDHTQVSRMVELGQLTAEEALTHPRRGELSQAVGGRPDVEPAVVAAAFGPGDWLVVCSDGLTSRLRPAAIQFVLEGAPSADAAARRLVNLANRNGAADNVSVAVVRGC